MAMARSMLGWTWCRAATALAMATLLAACGGAGPDPDAAAALGQALRMASRLEAPTKHRLVTAPQIGAVVDPVDAANQLMDFAEKAYPVYFPSHPGNALYEGYLYRHYPETGTYLAVNDGQVYVLGGEFGPEILSVGPLTKFITPVPGQVVDPPAPCTAVGVELGLYATPAPRVGRNAAATVAGCTGAIDTPQWVQTAGPAVALLSDKSQTISFDPPQAGTYAFQLSFVDPTGTPRTEGLSLVVPLAPAQSTGLTLRASQSVRMGGAVSVRAWPKLANGDAVAAIEWTQIEGPAVSLNTADPRAALFTAPDVSRDSLIRLRATLHTVQGQTSTDEALVLVERHQQAARSDPDAVWAGSHVQRVHAYRPLGPYANVLVRCTYDAQLEVVGSGVKLCPLSRLPFLAQDTRGAVPTVEQVMDRVIVSHDWLGRNFETFLRTQDPRGDFRRMLGSVTAVVLGTQVRPSFYYAGNGAIHLDADTFWLTPEERDTVNEAPDYRSEFGSALQYTSLWRYVQNNQNIFAYFDPEARVTRNTEDLRNESAWVMYHELGHALDFLPPADYSALDRRYTVWRNLYGRYGAGLLTSDTVSTNFPLRSTLLVGLGQVNFQGVEATATQKAYSVDLVAKQFADDLATDEYAYSSSREDTAMTLEEFLMSHRLGIRRDVGFIAKASGEPTPSSRLVAWGQRGRIGEPAMGPRAKSIVQALVPWVDASEVDRLPAPLALRAGESWKANLAQPAGPQLAQPLSAQPSRRELWLMQREFQRLQHPQHRGLPKLPPLELARR